MAVNAQIQAIKAAVANNEVLRNAIANQLTQRDAFDLILEHEDLEPLQTPFRITDPSMRKWVSMFDDTIKFMLNPNAKKGKGRQNFLYAQKQEDIKPAVVEQFRRYGERNPGISFEDAIRIFDQTGSNGKLKFLKQEGIDTSKPLSEFFK